MPLVQRDVVKAPLIRQAQKMFSASGWLIEEMKSFEVDFIATYNEFRLFIQCVDKAILAQETLPRIVEQYEACSRGMLFSRKATLIYLTNFDLADSACLIERSILLYNIRDVRAILELPKLIDDLPELKDPRLLSILSSKNKILLGISDRYLSQQNMEKALEWADYSVKHYPHELPSSIKITHILLQSKDYINAEKFVRQGLQYHPKNIILLKQLVKILRQQGRFEEQHVILKKLANIDSDVTAQYTTPADFVRYHSRLPSPNSPSKLRERSFLFKLLKRLGLSI